MQWYLTFIETWNDISLFWKPRSSTPDVTVWSNTSTSWGYETLTENKQLVLQWPKPLHALSNTHKKLIPIVIAGLVWEKCGAGKVVQFMSDNKAVVTVLLKLYCQDASLIAYLLCLIFSAAENSFWFTAEHIAAWMHQHSC